MKKAFQASGALILVLVVLGYLFREPVKDILFAVLTRHMFVASDNDTFDPGPATGSQFPGLHATYQGRTVTLIREFAGDNGTLFIASRSFVWCPYCIRQILQLQQYKAQFDAAGIGMVAISYDTPAQQRAFIQRFNITMPVLSDVNALSFKTLGILDDNYPPDDPQYGIAHPGMMVVDTEGRVVGKLFLESYRSRVDSAATLAFAKTVLGLDKPSP